MMTRKRILFVDDEAAILASLSNLLRKDRHRWDLVFAAGGPEAARHIERERFDVIITDMRMPDLDGAELLALVKARWPSTARIMLSGHAESDAVMRALPLVHQFISKPCDVKTLRGVIERCCADTGVGPDRSIAATIGNLPRLPSLPSAYEEMRVALANPRCTTPQLVAIIERDPALAAKTLHVANTSYFGTGQAVCSIPAAFATVGVEMMRQLVESSMIEPMLDPPAGFSIAEVCESSVRCAQLARRAVSDPKLAEEAYAAGLLHDLGRFVLAVELGERYGRVLETVARTGRPLYEVEQELINITHADVGAHLLTMWALPPTLIEAVAQHHAPRALPGTVHALVAAVQASAC